MVTNTVATNQKEQKWLATPSQWPPTSPTKGAGWAGAAGVQESRQASVCRSTLTGPLPLTTRYRTYLLCFFVDLYLLKSYVVSRISLGEVESKVEKLVLKNSWGFRDFCSHCALLVTSGLCSMRTLQRLVHLLDFDRMGKVV